YVRHDEAGIGLVADGPPDPLAHLDAHAVLGEFHIARPGHIGRPLRGQRRHETFGNAAQAGGIAGLAGHSRIFGPRRRWRRVVIERVVHHVRHIGEYRLDAMDGAIAHTECLDQRDGVRPLQRGAHLTPVGELVAVPLIRMVEETGGHYHAALDVDDRIAALADALVDAVDAELELGLAAR